MLVVAVALREPVPNIAIAARSQGISWTGKFFGAIYSLQRVTGVLLLLAGAVLICY